VKTLQFLKGETGQRFNCCPPGHTGPKIESHIWTSPRAKGAAENFYSETANQQTGKTPQSLASLLKLGHDNFAFLSIGQKGEVS
jgi:hypothetical protein